MSLLGTSASNVRRAIRRHAAQLEHPSRACYICAQCYHNQSRSKGPLLVTNTNLRTRHKRLYIDSPNGLQGQIRTQMAEAVRVPIEEHQEAPVQGPLDQYDRWVASGKLRQDEFQRQIVGKLQTLHDEIAQYEPPEVVHPPTEDLTPASDGILSSLFPKYSRHPLSKHDQDKNRSEAKVMFSYDTSKAPTIFDFSSLFHRRAPAVPKTKYDPENTPKGLYMFGDVGTGKTMLMNMFYHTLSPNIKRKKRIHFHQFMQDTHRRLHKLTTEHGQEFDGIPSVAADIAEEASVLCFDEFQCTDVADAMILRRLLECIMSHGVVMLSTSNRHPDELYKNGIQRESFIPCIKLLKTQLEVVNLNSPTDYRKIERPSSDVYYHPIGPGALVHANKWFSHLGDPKDPPHPASHNIWGREIKVPLASGKAARFTFEELCMKPRSAADYLELMKHYNAFVVTNIPEMTFTMKDLARRFITFIDAVYETRAALVITSEVPVSQLFIGDKEVKKQMDADGDTGIEGSMRMLMDDLGMDMAALKKTSIFSGDEEFFAFARALSRLSEMSSTMWVDQRQTAE